MMVDIRNESQTDSKKKVALLSNVTVDLIACRLRRKYDIYLPEGFDTWVPEVINPESGLYRKNLDCIVVLLDGTEARNWKSAEQGNERITLWERALSCLVDKITVARSEERRVGIYGRIESSLLLRENSDLDLKMTGISMCRD